MLKKFLEIIYKSFVEATKSRIWRFIGGSVSTVASILLIGKNFFGTAIVFSCEIGVAIFGFLFVFRFSIITVKNLLKNIHYKYVESIYGDAIILLKDAFANIHYLRKQTEFEDHQFMETMIIMCNCLKDIFDKKTRSTCSVSIKIPIGVAAPISESSELMNLCRDTSNSKIRDTEAYKRQKHTILGNSAYLMVVNKALKGNRRMLYYLNNNIETTKDYLNTSKDVYLDGKLPYKSELVVPITPIVPNMLKNDKRRGAIEKNFEIWGFLCVDCAEKEKFDEKYDLAIIEGVADGIVDVILAQKSVR